MNISRKKRQNKQIGGDLDTNIQPIVPEHSGLWGVIRLAANFVINGTIKGLESAIKAAAKTLNIDITENDLPGVLNELNKALKDPKTKEQVKEIAGELAEDAVIAMDIAGPELKELAEKITEGGLELIKKESKIAVDDAKEVATAIPGIGTGIGAAILVDNEIKGVEAIGDVLAKNTTAFADATNMIGQKFQDFQNQGKRKLQDFQNQGQRKLQDLQDQAIPFIAQGQDLQNQGQRKLQNLQDQAIPFVAQGQRKFQDLQNQGQRKLQNLQDQGKRKIQDLQNQGIEAQERAEKAIKIAQSTNLLGNFNKRQNGGTTRRHHKKRFKSILKSKKSTNGRLNNKTRKRKSKRVRFFAP